MDIYLSHTSYIIFILGPTIIYFNKVIKALAHEYFLLLTAGPSILILTCVDYTVFST